MTMNITHHHSYFTVKHTNLDNQVFIFLIVCLCTSRRDFKRSVSRIIKKYRLKLWILILEILLDPLLLQSNRFCQYAEKNSFEKKFLIMFLTHYMHNLCVTTIFIVISCMCHFVSRGKIFLIEYRFCTCDQSCQKGCTIS